ncbi:MAG TPA: DUF2306 domain-containing protein [Candidatus Acidoferrum sp.]|nr:DUF2306 domain-containing protein [Candidatus Acidoferrum sp.]
MASSATLSGGTSGKSSSRVITIGLLVVASVVAARFLIHYAAPYFRWDPKYFDYLWPHRVRLIVHICGGIVALVCGTLQLWTGLRQKAMTFHRWTGRIYLVGVAVGITGALLMTLSTTPKAFGVALRGLATAWLVTTLIAWAAILRGRVPMHKEWMVRSYLVTFAFVTFRVITDNLPGFAARLGSSPDDAAANVTWLSWIVPLAVYEVIRQSKRLFGTEPNS